MKSPSLINELLTIRKLTLQSVQSALNRQNLTCFDQFTLSDDELVLNISELIYSNFQVRLEVNFLCVPDLTVAKIADQIYLIKYQTNELPDIPLSDLQQGYLLGETEMFELGNFTALTFIELDLEKDYSVSELQATLNLMIARYEILRATITEDSMLRILSNPPTYTIPVYDLSHCSDQDTKVRIDQIREEMKNRPGSINLFPLFDIRLSRLNTGKMKLHFGINLITLDAYSWSRLISELLNPSLIPLRSDIFSYRDYVLNRLEQSSSTAYAESKQYWLNRIDQLPEPPELAGSFPPSFHQSSHIPRYERLEIMLSPEKRAKLLAAAKKNGVSINMVFCTAFAQVIATWSKSQRYLLNLMINDRAMNTQLEHILGNYSSTILVEIDLRESNSFIHRVKKVQAQFWNDFFHSSFNGVQVGRELTKTRGVNQKPWGSVVFASTLGAVTKNLGYTKKELVYRHLQTPQVYLDHQIFEVDNWILLSWEFAANLLPTSMVQDMMNAYENLLNDLADHPQSWSGPGRELIPSSQLALRKKINSEQRPVSEDTLHGLFLKSAQQFPTQTAIIDNGSEFSYAEVLKLALYYRNQLLQTGLSPGSTVGILMNKGFEQVIAALAIQLSGSAYVPIDPKLPPERISYILTNSKASVVMTQPGLDLAVSLKAIIIEPLSDLPEPDMTEIISDPQLLAYIIYTSGTTGVPKGVMINHLGAVNTILDINQRWNVGPKDRVLALSSFGFDLSVYDVFGLLAAGGTIVFPNRTSPQDPLLWLESVVNHQVTIWNSVPAFMKILTMEVSSKSLVLPDCLRLVLMSGDWIPTELPNEIFGLNQNIKIISLGGATEASIWSNYYPVLSVNPEWKSIPYGKPLTNQQFYVLNEAGEQCPDWVPGYLYIGGQGLALGYCQDPEKTNQSFAIHPRIGTQLYRTGDLGRYLPDGNIEFLGRQDSQVKVQGYRIELSEIETVLGRNPLVEAAIVSVVTLGVSKKIVAYVVPKNQISDQESFITELRNFLRKSLPEYMIPSFFEPLKAIPLSRNGKVDKAALPRPGETGNKVDLATTGLEKTLLQFWQQVLGMNWIGLDDNFFNLGGDSLAAVDLIVKIEANLNIEIPLNSLFQYPTIRELAEMIESRVNRQDLLIKITDNNSSAIPLVLIHPIGGNILCYSDLAKSMDRPIYAIRASGLSSNEPRLSSIPDMARMYLSEIKKLGLTRFSLGGWSMGGTIALEMARILGESGEQPRLILIDSPFTGESHLSDHDWVNYYLAKFLNETGIVGPGQKFDIVTDKKEAVINCIKKISLDSDIPTLKSKEMMRRLKVFLANAEALDNYRATSYSGPTLLIEANQNPKYSEYLGIWKNYLSVHSSISIGADHYSIMTEPRLAEVIDSIKNFLNKKSV